MEVSGRPSFRSNGGDRRLEIVSGKGYYYYNGNQISTKNHPRIADSPPVHPPATRTSDAAAAAAPSSKPWGFRDPEMKRRKRIARYKVYTVEGRVKASIRRGFRWIKNKCSEIIHGY